MKQLSLITQGKIGLIAEITEALAAENINIENIDAKSFEDKAVIVMSVDNYELAMEILERFESFQIVAEDVILIKLQNEPGALAKIARRFTDAKISLRSISFVHRNQEAGLVAISAERSAAALELVKDELVS